jgi:hypothetical protein
MSRCYEVNWWRGVMLVLFAEAECSRVSRRLPTGHGEELSEVRRRTGRAVKVRKDRGAAMARKIFTDESDRRALGIIRVASSVPPAAPQRPERAGTDRAGVVTSGSATPRSDVGAARVEAPDWVVAWSRVAATR